MSNYDIFWKKSAVKELKSLPKNISSRIISIVEKLKEEPRPEGVIKLEN
jgi:mRNA-degrading endonuclease RelE of RelBE toxin-antitoxin system